MPYRAVVRNVRYWRGQIKRWQSVYPFIGTPTSGITASDCQLVFNAHSKMLFNGGAANGGAYECAIYNQASGGVPVAVYTAFNYLTPAAWLAPVGSVWSVSGAVLGTPAEQALIVEWAAGLSHSGKPVTLKKFYHQVQSIGGSGANPDVSATNVTALVAQANAITVCLAGKGLSLGSPSGRFAGSASVKSYYGNHQMVRGRRKRISLTQAQRDADFSKILEIIQGEAQTS